MVFPKHGPRFFTGGAEAVESLGTRGNTLVGWLATRLFALTGYPQAAVHAALLTPPGVGTQ
jgi:hypothetical protein